MSKSLKNKQQHKMSLASHSKVIDKPWKAVRRALALLFYLSAELNTGPGTGSSYNYFIGGTYYERCLIYRL